MRTSYPSNLSDAEWETLLGWLSRNRRMSKDYERKVQGSRNAHGSGDDSVADRAPGTEEVMLSHTRAGVTEPPRSRRASSGPIGVILTKTISPR